MLKKTPAERDKEFVAAARAGDDLRVREMLARGINPDVRSDGFTALSRAVVFGGQAVVATLLAAGANPDRKALGKAPGAELRTPLHMAAFHRKTEVLQMLLAAGANARAVDDNHNTAANVLLRQALPFGAGPREESQLLCALEQLFDAGCPVNQANHLGDTLLSNAIERFASRPILDALLVRGANPYVTGTMHGRAPVHFACENGRHEQLRALVAHGVDMNAPTRTGLRPLHIFDSTEAGEVILATRPDLEAQDHHGRTAIAHRLLACRPADVDAHVVQLIVAGASLDTPDYERTTPRTIIAERKLKGMKGFIAAGAARAAMSAVTQCHDRGISKPTI